MIKDTDESEKNPTIDSVSDLGVFLYIIRSLIILGILCLFLKIEIESVFRVVLYQYYFLGFFVLATVILFCLFAIKDVVSFIKQKKATKLLFSIIGSVIIGSGLLIRTWNFKRHIESTKYKAYVELKDSKIEDSYKILFRENGNVLIDVETEEGLVSEYYFGHYVLKNNFFYISYLFGRDWKYAKFKLVNKELIPFSDKNKVSSLKLNFFRY
jgi:hypothetical protein